MPAKDTDRISKLIKALTDANLDATRLSDDNSPCVVSDFISTGCVVLDAIMGGGLPCGRVVEIYGDTSTGKSLVASQACATIQQEGGVAVYIDTETSVSLPIMEAVGVDTSTLIYLAPDTVEEVFKAMEAVVDAKEQDVPMLVVWDSIAATSAKSEMEKDTGETGYLTHARVISQGLRKFTRQIAHSGVACLFLNQAKENIGIMWGDKVATFGGKAVGFHSSVRIMLTVTSKIKATKDKNARVVGINAHAKVTKNKIAPPFREADLPIYFGRGIDEAKSILEYLKSVGMVKYGNGVYSIDVLELKFKMSEWSKMLDTNWDRVCNLVFSSMERGDLL